MRDNDNSPYILGTENKELWRLGFQHQVWSSEARKGWEIAQFRKNQHLLDLGCGPGFCTKELAYLVGPKGKVTGVDKSQVFIDHLQKLSTMERLNLKLICENFDVLDLPMSSFDGIFIRWALAWINNPKAILSKSLDWLKPGGKIVVQEYYNFETLDIYPRRPSLVSAKEAIKKSFRDMEGNINIGRELPGIFDELGMELVSIRPLNKIGTPKDLVWNWPKTFFNIYLPKVTEMGLIKEEVCLKALEEFNEIEKSGEAILMGPSMIEIVAQKN